MSATADHDVWTAALRRAAAQPPGTAPRRPWPRWLMPSALATAAVVLGTVGSLQTGYAAGDSAPLAHALYNAVRCFSLNGPAEGDLAWPLDVARFLAPLASVWGAVAALAAATAGRRRQRRVLAGSGHTLVCGLGTEGLRLAFESLAAGETVVALERDEGCVGIAAARERGVVALVGDATDPAVLSRAGMARATRLITTVTHAADNLAVACAAAEIARDHPAQLALFARCADDELAAAVARRRLLGQPGGRARLWLFSREAGAARQLVTDHLPLPLAQAARAGRVPHVLVVGDGAGRAQTLRRLLEAPATAQLPAVYVTLAAPDATARVAGLDPEAEAAVAHWSAVDVHVGSPEELLALQAQVHARRPLDAVVLHLEHTPTAVACALRACVAPRTAIPVFVRLREAAGLEPLLAPAVGEAASVVVFGLDRDVTSRAVVVGGALDLLARRIHEDYRRAAVGVQVLPWDELDPDLVHSNWSQADHIPMKLALLGRSLRTSQAPIGPEDIERLARIEHVRWCCERRLAGWRYAAGPRDLARRTSPDLVPWEALGENARELDRAVVRRIPSLLTGLGE